MTTQEFSDQFDVLYNSITSNQAPGLDEYEKSVFLTKAQTEILLSYFDPRLNKTQEGFDDSQRRQIDFSMLIRTYNEPSDISSTSKPNKAEFDPRDNSISIWMPEEILLILNERVTVERNLKQAHLRVVPITFTEYDRLMSKPYKRPLKWQAWRLFNANDEINTADIILGPEDTFKQYSIRYLKRPNPIILSDLDGLTIEGKSTMSWCELDPILHQDILQRAVELANAVYKGDLSSQLVLGQQSQTEIGQINYKQ